MASYEMRNYSNMPTMRWHASSRVDNALNMPASLMVYLISNVFFCFFLDSHPLSLQIFFQQDILFSCANFLDKPSLRTFPTFKACWKVSGQTRETVSEVHS